MKKIYKARNRAPFPKNKAQEFGERIELIQDKKNRSKITVDDFLEDAELEDSPFHEYLEWDNEIASEKFRRYQARNIMNGLLVVVVKNETEETEPAFYNVVVKNGEDENAYVPIDIAKGNEDLTEQILEEAESKLKSWIFRYKGFMNLKQANNLLNKNWKE